MHPDAEVGFLAVALAVRDLPGAREQVRIHPKASATRAPGDSASVQHLLESIREQRTANRAKQLLQPHQVHRALYPGDLERLRSFMRRMAKGEDLNIALVGGSISYGMGAVEGEPSFGRWLSDWLAAVAPLNPGPPPEYGPPDAPAAVQPTDSIGAAGGADTHGAFSPSGSAVGAVDRSGSGAASRRSAVEGAAGFQRSSTRTIASGMANGTVVGGEGRSRVRVINAACPATTSAYMNICLREYLPPELPVHLVLVEYAVNDDPAPSPAMNNEARKSMELLLRKILSLPDRPAVVLLNAFSWFSRYGYKPDDGVYYLNAEAQLFDFATYYGLPMLSVKAAAYHQMAAGVQGFKVDTLRHQHRYNMTADPEAQFYEDPMHPSGLTGHKVIAELIIGLFTHAAKTLQRRSWNEASHSASDHCLLGDKLRGIVAEARGFEWVNEGRSPLAPKWGFTATTPGSTIAFVAEPPAAAVAAPPAASSPAVRPGLDPYAVGLPSAAEGGPRLVTLILAYLRSYENMGVGLVTCEGCLCGERARIWIKMMAAGSAAFANKPPLDPEEVVLRLEGHWDTRTSQLQLACFPAIMEPGCRVRVTVKLGGLLASEAAPNMAAEMCAHNLEAAQRAAGYIDLPNVGKP
ncbi:hypothetical protein HYH03_007100 [Edaphochlamys debaryana]|uniref:SGNH hydrolase-type esterase domain-containing protein n=1 Tax=Edaphochlamys debaryana TaxID=47281 RepID=A0A836BZN9_9CHLO|nr:hypothetical protein HYH03_007100 [Edaphochlamys debaryana]|eukprot:KAG2494860.1 hypothetical protein HYH03_007100 [Edaphochlamys debaryana]